MRDLPPIYMQAFFFVLGGIVGSFLNVCIYRLPRELSIVRPGSACTSCGTSIRFYDNIPFISYLILRGRCRKCGATISTRYLLVEMITALLFVGSYLIFALSLNLAAVLVLSSLLIVISFVDLDFKIIPDILSLGGIGLGILLSFFRPNFGYINSLLGVLVGGGILFAVAKLYELVRKTEGMGVGDIKLLAMIGAFCGYKGVLFALVSGSLLGALVGIPLMLVKREGSKYAIPFGPFLSLGALIFALAGEDIVRALFYVLAPK